MKHMRDLMLNTLVKIRSVNGLPSMPPYEDLRMIAESISSSLNCLTRSPFNSLWYLARSRLASSRCSSEKRKGNSSSSEQKARLTLANFPFAFGCPCHATHAGQKFQLLLSFFSYRVKRKNPTKTWEADSKKLKNFGDSFIFIMNEGWNDIELCVWVSLELCQVLSSWV